MRAGLCPSQWTFCRTETGPRIGTPCCHMTERERKREKIGISWGPGRPPIYWRTVCHPILNQVNEMTQAKKHLNDRVDILLLFSGGVGVIKAQNALAAHLLGIPKVQVHGLGVPRMQKSLNTIRPGMDDQHSQETAHRPWKTDTDKNQCTNQREIPPKVAQPEQAKPQEQTTTAPSHLALGGIE